MNLVYSAKTPQVGDKCLLIQTGNNKYCIPLTNEDTSTSEILSTFEVMPNKTEIASSTVDSKTGLTYNTAIPACTIHKMTLGSLQEPEDCDVVIDWGDGIVESIKEGNYTGHTEGTSYELSHDYAPNMTEDVQRFIVKIKGKNYYTFRHDLYKDNNLISRIFDVDLPIASFVTNFASMVFGASRILSVKFPHSTKPFPEVWNWSFCFNECANIVSITGFEDIALRGDANYNGIMSVCERLTTTDFVIPASITSIPNIFTGDKNLECDINNLIPAQGFSSSNIFINAPFNYLSKMVGTVPADKLWGDERINWIFKTSDRPFMNCSDEIRAQVPISWGGTASDDIIKPRPVEGYFRKEITNDTTAQSGYWYICTTSGLTLTLTSGSTGDYIRFSTNYLAENVVIKPADGETIDGDAEGFTLDKTSGTVEMLWTGSGWTVIEAK